MLECAAPLVSTCGLKSQHPQPNLLDDSTKPEEVAIVIEQRELAHAPWLVFDALHSWDSLNGEIRRQEFGVKAVHVDSG